MKFKSIKAKILIWFGVVTFTILFVFSGAFYYFFNKSVNTSIESRLYKQATSIKNKLSSGADTDEMIKQYPASTFDLIIMKNGKVLDKTKNFDLDIPKTGKTFFIIDYGEYLSAVYALNFTTPFKGKIVLVQKNIDDKVEDLVDTMLWLDPILLILLIFIASKLIDKILFPIKSITKIANEININNLLSTIHEPKDDDEIKELVSSFNAMIKRLESGVEKMERFNNDVSHELKTPLTVIRGEAEITLHKPRESKEYISCIKTMEKEAAQIQKIVDGLLLLTKYSKTNIQDSFEFCSIDTILLDTIKKYNRLMIAKNISLKIQKIEAVSTKANPLLIETIFSNLIDNAIKYTSKDKNIYISLCKNDKIHFTIEDEGIGIPKDKLPFITDRFYRVDESRNKKTDGFGLGLSIVKNSVELHRGELHIESKEGIGTKIEVFL